MTAWPDSLPGCVSRHEYQETTQQTAIRTQPDAGPYKARQRFTASIDKFSVRLPKLTSAQCTTLMSFFKTDIAGGSLPFDWKHPRTGVSATLIMTNEPTIAGVGPFYTADFELGVLP